MSWVPIESNPDVMNKFLTRMGVPNKWKIIDVLSLDKDMLGMIPKPTVAMILLYPTSIKHENLKKEQDESKEKNQEISPNLFFLHQIISNSCGSVALVHAISNNLDKIQLGDGFLKQFIEDAKSLTPELRGKILAENKEFADAHASVAADGQTQVPPDDDSVFHHYVAFVCKDNILYELDGRKKSPTNHGPCSEDKFIEDSAEVISGIMQKDPNEVRFTVIALSSSV